MPSREEGQTYYEILEIRQDAGPTEIYNAYQRARSTYSPSSPALYSMFSPEEAQQLMSLIEEAYQCLSHQARRRDYDKKMGSRPQSVAQAALEASRPAEPKRGPVEGKKGDDSWMGPVRVLQKREELPKGFARTKFSVYEVKPEIENEIKSITECDGSFLQKMRLYKGVSLEDLCDEIRVTKSTLVALESNDLEALPVAVFTRGFVLSYARCLGLSEKHITDTYMKFFKARKK